MRLFFTSLGRTFFSSPRSLQSDLLIENYTLKFPLSRNAEAEMAFCENKTCRLPSPGLVGTRSKEEMQQVPAEYCTIWTAHAVNNTRLLSPGSGAPPVCAFEGGRPCLERPSSSWTFLLFHSPPCCHPPDSAGLLSHSLELKDKHP